MIVVAFVAIGVGAAQSDERRDFFEQRIRPVLVEHCYECHSASSDSVEGGLTLDTREGIRRGGDSGPAVVPGDIDASLLLRAVHYEPDAIQMPPTGKLPDHVLADLQTWIVQGAVDPRNEVVPETLGADAASSVISWAFQPLDRSRPPTVDTRGWGQDLIDRYVLARLEQAGLQPAGRADQRTRLRRLYFDLVGLPPSPDQVADYCRDASPDAWAKIVDRLLASPGFAEHWARKWLDVVRYADSNGNDFNATYHQAWRYRNYVIDSLAADKPYERFVREQLAGDLMPYDHPSQRAEQLIATAFLMLGPKMLSERDKEKLQLDVADEQIDTYGKALLGLTLGCARCHDHKFDPVSSHDYYALAGIFCSTATLQGEIQEFVSNWVEQELPMEPEHARQLAAYRHKKQALEDRIKQLEDQRSETQTAVDRASLIYEGLVVDNGEVELRGMWKESTSVKRFVGKDYLHDDNQDKGQKSAQFIATIPMSGQYEVRVAYTTGSNRATNVPVEIRHDTAVERLTLDQTRAPTIDGLFEPLGRFSFSAGTHPVVVVANTATDGFVVVDAVQLVPIAMADAGDGVGSETQATVATDQIAALRSELTRLQDQSRELKEQLRQIDEQAPPPAPRAMAARDVSTPCDVAIRIRGMHTNRGSIVPRGFLQVLSSGNAPVQHPRQSGRLELADWTTSAAQPLLARVIVNRIWHHLMGAGIVRTCDNFGQLGELPTHPDLLDRLAADFIEHNGSIKYLVKRVVLSETYQMQVDVHERGLQVDPDNRLLWHAHRKRLSAEQLRDAMLSLSGLLDHRPGESPVADLGQLVNNNSANEAAYQGRQTHRRSIYMPVVRNELPDLLVAFDFADPDRVVGRRPETNVPGQALLLLNHPFVRDVAERMAGQILPAADDPQRLKRLYQLLFQRDPQPAELRRDLAFIQGVRAEAEEPSAVEPIAWTQLCHALLASTEFRYLD
jgi:cell division protein FtsB